MSYQIISFPVVSPSIAGIKAVLFDCDGVLCHFLRFAQVLEREYEITREMTSEFFKKAFLPALLGNADVLAILPPFLEQWRWKGSAQEFLELWLFSEREVKPGMIDIVNELRQAGYYVGAATNQELHRASYLRSQMGFDKLFDQSFISSELGYMKPEPEYFQVVTSRIGVAPHQILFIDDQQNYLKAASECGWRTILFTDEQDTRQKLEAMLKPAAEVSVVRK